MKVAAYIRVSSKAQDHATQRDAIEREATARGTPVAEWYAEKQSAKTTDRPELNRLRADVRAGKVRTLYVFRLDRLTRSGIRDTLEIVEECKAADCKLVSLTDGFDVSGSFAEVIVAVMAWAAKMELVSKNERVAAARVRVEAAGGAWGRPKRWGATEAAQAARMRQEGRTVRQIAVALKIPRATVGRMLSQKDQAKKEGAGTSGKPPPSN